MKTTITTNYDQFKLLTENRPITKGHVATIVDSIQRENLLHLYPLVVDEENYVIDGQHRLFAAKELGIPLHYTVLTGKRNPETLFLLQNSKNWGLIDFISYYSKTDSSKGYDRFYKDNEKWGIEITTLGNLYGLFTHAPFLRGAYATKKRIQKGTFNFDEVDLVSLDQTLEQYVKYRDFCEKRKITPRTIYRSCGALMGFCTFASYYEPDWEIFFYHLQERWHVLYPAVGKHEHVKLLLGVYNWQMRKNKTHSFEHYETEKDLPSFTLAQKKNYRNPVEKKQKSRGMSNFVAELAI